MAVLCITAHHVYLHFVPFQGSPGTLVKAWNPTPSNVSYAWALKCDPNDSTQQGYHYSSTTQLVSTEHNECLDSSSATEGTVQFAPCDSTSPSQKFIYNVSQFCPGLVLVVHVCMCVVLPYFLCQCQNARRSITARAKMSHYQCRKRRCYLCACGFPF